MSDQFLSSCTFCFAEFRLKDPTLIGKRIRCPKCGEPFKVESLEESLQEQDVSAVESPGDDLDRDFDDWSDFEDSDWNDVTCDDDERFDAELESAPPARSRRPNNKRDQSPANGKSKQQKKSSSKKKKSKPASSSGIDWGSTLTSPRVISRLIGLTIVGVIALGSWLIRPSSPDNFSYKAPTQSQLSLREVRSQLETRLTREGPAPQEFDEAFSRRASIVPFASNDVLLFGSLRLPPGRGPHPAVVYCHGGFAAGEGDEQDAEVFLKSGFAIFVPAWRGENGNPGNFELYLGEAEDAVAAMEYLATQPRIDPERIFIAGHSIGATVAMLAAELSTRPRGVAAVGGMLDLYAYQEEIRTKLFEEMPFNFIDEQETLARSPGQFLHELSCPTRLYYGEDEFQPSVDIAQKLSEAGGGLGKRVEFKQFDGTDHFTCLQPALVDATRFFLDLLKEDRQSPVPVADRTEEVEFLKRRLRPIAENLAATSRWGSRARKVSLEWTSTVDPAPARDLSQFLEFAKESSLRGLLTIDDQGRTKILKSGRDSMELYDLTQRTVHRIDGVRPSLWNAASRGSSSIATLSPDGQTVAMRTSAEVGREKYWTTLHSTNDFNLRSVVPNAATFEFIGDAHAIITQPVNEGPAEESRIARLQNRVQHEIRFVDPQNRKISNPVTVRRGGCWTITPNRRYLIISEPDEGTAKGLGDPVDEAFDGNSSSTTLSVYGAKSGERLCRAEYEGVSSGIALAVSPDGQHLVSVSQERIGIWNLATGEVAVSAYLPFQLSEAIQSVEFVAGNNWIAVNGHRLIHRPSGHDVADLEATRLEWFGKSVRLGGDRPPVEVPFDEFENLIVRLNDPQQNLLLHRQVGLELSFQFELPTEIEQLAQAYAAECLQQRFGLTVVPAEQKPPLIMSIMVSAPIGATSAVPDTAIYVSDQRQPSDAPAIRFLRDRSMRTASLLFGLKSSDSDQVLWSGTAGGAELPPYLDARFNSAIQLSLSSFASACQTVDIRLPVALFEDQDQSRLPITVQLDPGEELPQETDFQVTTVPINLDWLKTGLGGLPYRRPIAAFHELTAGFESRQRQIHVTQRDGQPFVLYRGISGKAWLLPIGNGTEPELIDVPAGSRFALHKTRPLAFGATKSVLTIQSLQQDDARTFDLGQNITAVQLSPTQELLAVAVAKQGIRIVRVEDLLSATEFSDIEPLNTFEDAGIPDRLAFSGNEQMLGTTERNGESLCWNRKLGYSLFLHKPDAPHGGDLRDCAVSADGQWLYVIEGNELIEFELKALNPRRRLILPGMQAIRMAPDGKRLAVGLSTWKVRMIDPQTMQPTDLYPVDTGTPLATTTGETSVEWSADGTMMVVANERGDVTVWDMTTAD